MTFHRTLSDHLRDQTGIGYGALTRVFEPSFTSQVGAWPLLALLPLRAPPHPDLWVTSLLRRDLAFAGKIAVLSHGDSPQQTYEDVRERLRASGHPMPWKLLAGAGGELREGRLVLRGMLLRADRPGAEEQLSVEGPVEQLAALTVQFVERFAEALRLTPSDRARTLWNHGRPVSWQSLLDCARAGAEEDLGWVEAAVREGRIHPDAVVVAEGGDDQEDLARRLLVLALEKDPSHPEIGFRHFCNIWKGQGRDSAGARILLQGLRDAPGTGKSQMCLAHLFPHLPSNVAHILAHAEAGYRLLPGNNFAISNFMGYLECLAPKDPRRANLIQEMLDADSHDPRVLKQAMDFYIQTGKPRTALDLALHFKKLVSDPADPRTLYCFRQNPVTAAALDSGEFKPLEDALRCVGICERAVREAERH